MGAVYRAVDEILDLTVAIKENTVLEEGSTRQFQREAQILASLRHPNLPRVFEYFQVEGLGQYLVMDFIDGEDLRGWMSQEDGVTEMEALQIGIEICNALIFLHSQEPAITHRDIKPGNIKFSPYGEVILVDFGLVKVLQDQEDTTTAARAMTPGYAPPEQYGEGATDHRTDVFSLGATLYAALTGYQPEDSLAGTRGKTQRTALRSYQPHVSIPTARAIEKALNLRFEDRWQSAQDFKSALIKARDALSVEKRAQTRLGVLDQPDTQKRDPSRDKPERESLPFFAGIRGIKQGKLLDPVWLIFDLVVISLLVVLSLTVLGQEGLLAILNRPTHSPSVETQAVDSGTEEHVLNLEDTPEVQAETQPVPTTMVPTIYPTPAGGGSGRIAYVSERTGTPQIWLVDVTSKVSTQLTDFPDGACQPDWSPDGTRIVFTSPCTAKRVSYPGSRLVIIDVDSRELTPLPASLEGDFDPAWSPDGEWIAYTTLINGRPQLIKIRLDDLQSIRLSQGTYPDYSPAWSPDGDQLAFVRERGV
jgi:serine/threonine protein kinase